MRVPLRHTPGVALSVAILVIAVMLVWLLLRAAYGVVADSDTAIVSGHVVGGCAGMGTTVVTVMDATGDTVGRERVEYAVPRGGARCHGYFDVADLPELDNYRVTAGGDTVTATAGTPAVLHRAG